MSPPGEPRQEKGKGMEQLLPTVNRTYTKAGAAEQRQPYEEREATVYWDT